MCDWVMTYSTPRVKDMKQSRHSTILTSTFRFTSRIDSTKVWKVLHVFLQCSVGLQRYRGVWVGPLNLAVGWGAGTVECGTLVECACNSDNKAVLVYHSGWSTPSTRMKTWLEERHRCRPLTCALLLWPLRIDVAEKTSTYPTPPSHFTSLMYST